MSAPPCVLLLSALAAAACTTDEPNPIVGPTRDAAACPPPKVLFLNRHETTYSPSTVDNSALNVSRIVGAWGEPGQAATLAAFPFADELWNEVLLRVQRKFTPYNIDVVDIEPESGEYFETMVTGSEFSILDATIDGKGPTFISCEQVPRAVNFVFDASSIGEDPERLATAIAAHTTLRMELLSPVNSPGHVLHPWWTDTWDGAETTFLDEDSLCGGQCFCGGGTVNAHLRLLKVLGPACTEKP